MSPLISLKDHDARQATIHAASQPPQGPAPNGIACPECGKELVDTSPSTILTGIPPRRNVSCQCGYVGTRIA